MSAIDGLAPPMKAPSSVDRPNLAVAAPDPLTLKLWPDGAPTAMKPKSEATVKLIQSYGGAGPNRITDVT